LAIALMLELPPWTFVGERATMWHYADQSKDALIRANPSFVSGSILRRLCPPDETRFEKMRRT
jgi:hypothetical protein